MAAGEGLGLECVRKKDGLRGLLAVADRRWLILGPLDEAAAVFVLARIRSRGEFESCQDIGCSDFGAAGMISQHGLVMVAGRLRGRGLRVEASVPGMKDEQRGGSDLGPSHQGDEESRGNGLPDHTKLEFSSGVTTGM